MDASPISQILVNGIQATIDGITWNCSVPLAQEGENVLSVIASDSAGNESAPINITIILVTSPPTVEGVSATNDDGSYKAGAQINLVLNFSENVTLTDRNLILTLNSGATVNVEPFGPANTVTANYEVAAGENSADHSFRAARSR